MAICIFCDIVAGNSPAEWAVRPDFWPDTVAFYPHRPVVEGHVLVVPRVHVEDFVTDPMVTATTMHRAAELASLYRTGSSNLVTSRGADATQTVFHLHVHLVPRSADDGLRLPWTKSI